MRKSEKSLVIGETSSHPKLIATVEQLRQRGHPLRGGRAQCVGDFFVDDDVLVDVETTALLVGSAIHIGLEHIVSLRRIPYER
jgi:hypothetical protein